MAARERRDSNACQALNPITMHRHGNPQRWSQSNDRIAGVLTLPTRALLQRRKAEVLLCRTMERIEVHELRQHASRYLARVATGETIEVTDEEDHAVALLVPTGQDGWLDLVAAGQVVPAAIEGNLVDEAPDDYGIDASAQLAAMRDDER